MFYSNSDKLSTFFKTNLFCCVCKEFIKIEHFLSYIFNKQLYYFHEKKIYASPPEDLIKISTILGFDANLYVN